MLDFDGAVIKRLINKGECTGAMLSTSTNEYLILDVATLLKLREHLENFGQRLDNAYITRIGTIVPYDNLKKVEDVEVLEVTETFQELNDLSSPATNAECNIPNFKNSQTIELWIGTKYKSKIEKSATFINSNDIEFLRTLQDEEFILKQAELIAKIDGAKFINHKSLALETPFGVADIENISTGLKTALNVLHKIKKFPGENFCVNLDECGNDVLCVIFEMHSGSNVFFYLSRSFYIQDFTANYEKYIINGKRPKSRDELIEIMESKEMI